MPDYTTTMVIWLALLVIAIPYVNHIRHPDRQPVVAYTIFLAVFLCVFLAIYAVIGGLVAALDSGSLLDRMGTAIALMLMAFIPAFLLARRLARKPPFRHSLQR